MTFIIQWNTDDPKPWKRDEQFGSYELKADTLVEALLSAQDDMPAGTRVVLVAEKEWLEAL